MANFIIGYVICINIISYMFIWLNIRTEYIKISKKWVDTIYLIFSILGGFVGIMVASEMFNYRKKEKLFKRWIPLVIFIEACIIIYIIYKVRI